MTARSAAIHRPSVLRLVAPLASALHRALYRIDRALQRRALAAELSGLSDRELADIGLSRPSSPAARLGLPHALYR